jgi:hypothetical protein
VFRTRTPAATYEASPIPDNTRGRSSDILYSVMSILRVLRVRRVSARIACLALFLAGSNSCLLGAWGGNAAMACLALPVAAAQTPVRCHHCTPARAGHESARPSCCPAPVVTPQAPSIDRADVAMPTSSDLFAAVVPASLPIASAWHGPRVLPDGRPPTRLARAPLPARAPPLA